MFVKTFLLSISISSFLTTGFISAGKQQVALFILKFFLLLLSLLSLAAFFLKARRFQDILEQWLGERVIIILLSIGSVFFLTMSFLLHGEDGEYVISTALDPIAYYIQAKIFATGHINVPSHALKDFFTTGYFINDGKYYSTYFPGWPFILAIGVALGFPWVINPLFGLLTLFIVYLIGKEIYDRGAGLFAAVLLLFSLNYYFFTPSYMSETSALFFSSLFFYLMVKTVKKPNNLTCSLAGLFLGVTFLIRPFSALAVSLPILTYFSFSPLFNRRKTAILLGLVVLTFLPALFTFFLYNYHQTGSMFLTPMQYYNPFNTLGFGLRSSDIILNPKPYTLFDGLKNMSINLALLNWQGVLFLFVFLFLVLTNKKNKWDILLFATIVAIIFLHLFFFARATRYYYTAFFALCLLAARGINLADISAAKIFSNKPIKKLNYLILLFIVIANTFIVVSPERVFQRYRVYTQLRDPFNLAKRKNLKNSVVFLKTVPERYNNITYYVQNHLDFSGDVLFVKDLKERNAELMEYYTEKDFYVYEFDQGSKSGKLTRLR